MPCNMHLEPLSRCLHHIFKLFAIHHIPLWCRSFFFFFLAVSELIVSFTDIDGLGDMRLICGITVAEEKDRLAREDKV